MKKWALAVLMAICLVLPGKPGIARAAEQGWIYDPAAETLTSGTTVLNNVHADKQNLAIGDNASRNLTHVNLAGNILDSAGTAYQLTGLNYKSFENCKSLTTVLLPEGIDYIDYHAFKDCSSLSSINIPNSVSSIGFAAFSGCSSLNSITIPERVTSIKNYTFWECIALESVDLPKGLETIGAAAFAYCQALESISIPDGVASISPSAFSGCSSLTSVALPTNITSIQTGVFDGCKSLRSVLIPESVTDIEFGAFSECDSLGSINLPIGLQSIGSYAFGRCNNLVTITLHENVTTISNAAFYGCPRLKTIFIHASNPPAIDGDIIERSEVRDIVVPAPSLQAYKSDPAWARYRDELKAGFSLTVNDEPTGKLHLSGSEVSIYAAPSKDACHPFDHWDLTGVQVENADESPLTFTMPENDVVATPVYVERHAWSEPEWTWSENGRSCEAAFACANDPSHAETVEAEVTSAVKTPATCTENGVTAYTATAEHEGETFTATAERADVPATGHTFENGTCTECGAKDPNHKPDEKPVVPEGGTGDSSRPGAPNDPDSKPSDNQIENPGNGQVGQGGNGRPENQDNQSVSSGGETLVQTGDASLAFAAASCLGGLIAATGISMRKRAN